MIERAALKLAAALVFAGPCGAKAFLTSSYDSDAIVIATDERRTGPVDGPTQVGPSLDACWQAPHARDEISVRLSFRRDGSVFGQPRVVFEKVGGSESRAALTRSILAAIKACMPLPFTPRLGASIAGRVFLIRFIAPAAG